MLFFVIILIMNDGKIYKIELGDYLYVGSTKNSLSRRAASHNSCIKTRTSKLYRMAREQGVTRLKCIWVEDYKYDHLDQLRAREEFWRKKLCATLNAQKCYLNYGTEIHSKNHRCEEWRKLNPNARKEYYELNKEREYELHKKYFAANKKKIYAKRRENRLKNRDAINAKRRANSKAPCDVCGKVISKSYIKKHQLTSGCNKH